MNKIFLLIFLTVICEIDATISIPGLPALGLSGLLSSLSWLQFPMNLFQFSGNMVRRPNGRTKFLMGASKGASDQLGKIMAPTNQQFWIADRETSRQSNSVRAPGSIKWSSEYPIDWSTDIQETLSIRPPPLELPKIPEDFKPSPQISNLLLFPDADNNNNVEPIRKRKKRVESSRIEGSWKSRNYQRTPKHLFRDHDPAIPRHHHQDNFQYKTVLENALNGKPTIFLEDPSESGYYVGDGELIPVPMMTKLPNYFLRN